jgi:phage terminase large subunit
MELPEISGTINLKFLIDNEDKRIKVLEGSSRSSKTFSIIQYLILFKLIQIDNYVVRCWRFNAATHNDTTIADFKDVMEMIGESKGIENYFEYAGTWNSSKKVYTFANGSMIAFNGTMDEQKIQGKKQNCSWFNEAMEISKAAYDQAAMRTSEMQILDYNPSFNHHWVFSSILTRIESGEVAYQHSTYKDNKFIPPEQVAEIEKFDPENPENVKNGTADQWTWDVYGLGKRGKIQGAIFTFWEVWDGPFPEPIHCQRFGYGMDFGFSLDPSTLIECSFFQDVLYLREVIYEQGLLTTPNISRPEVPNIVDEMKFNSIDKEHKIYADSAAAEAIQDIRMCGYNIIPCEKGKGSVLQGIKLLQRVKMRVHRNSLNLQRELEHYRWRKRTAARESEFSKYEEEPEDKNNHAIDAIRYWARAEIQRAQNEVRKHERNGGFRKPRIIKSGLRSRRR